MLDWHVRLLALIEIHHAILTRTISWHILDNYFFKNLHKSPFPALTPPSIISTKRLNTASCPVRLEA